MRSEEPKQKSRSALRRSILTVSLTSLFLAWVLSGCISLNKGYGATLKGRVVVLGDSITYGGQYVEYIETVLRLSNPKADFEIINVGLPSETVSGLSEDGHAGGQFPRPDLHERLARVLEKTKPNMVLACYGMNDGIYFPFGEERFQKYVEGITWLREEVAKTGATLTLITPPVFDPLPIKSRTLPAGQTAYPKPYVGYNNVLDKYSEWLLSKRAQGWDVVDLHGPMNQFLAQKRVNDPSFHVAGDGVHPNETGHWVMARPILVHFGAPASIATMESIKPFLASYATGDSVLSLIQQKQRMMKDAWLTDTGHKRPGMKKGLPMAEAQSKAADLEKKIQLMLSPAPAPEIRRDQQGRITLHSSVPNLVIRYSLDGTDPRVDEGEYLAPIDLPEGGMVKARLFESGKNAASLVASNSFEPIQPLKKPVNSALIPVTQNRDWRSYDWSARHAAILAMIQTNKPGLVFIGDSITHMFGGEPAHPHPRGPGVWQEFYSKRNAINMGYGWDRTENVIWRIQHGELDGISPKAIVLMIGTNNLDKNSPDEIAEAIAAICGQINKRLPQTKILLVAILPRSQKPDAYRAKIGEINKLTAKLNGQNNVTWLDAGSGLVQPDGSISQDIMSDYLHPTSKGYAIYAKAIEPVLAKLLGE